MKKVLYFLLFIVLVAITVCIYLVFNIRIEKPRIITPTKIEEACKKGVYLNDLVCGGEVIGWREYCRWRNKDQIRIDSSRYFLVINGLKNLKPAFNMMDIRVVNGFSAYLYDDGYIFQDDFPFVDTLKNDTLTLSLVHSLCPPLERANSR